MKISGAAENASTDCIRWCGNRQKSMDEPTPTAIIQAAINIQTATLRAEVERLEDWKKAATELLSKKDCSCSSGVTDCPLGKRIGEDRCTAVELCAEIERLREALKTVRDKSAMWMDSQRSWCSKEDLWLRIALAHQWAREALAAQQGKTDV